MEQKVIEIIKKDIERCKQQTVNEGSYKKEEMDYKI